MWLWLGGGLALLLIVAIVIGVTSSGGSSSSSPSGGSDREDSGHDICVTQMMAIVEHLSRGGDQPYIDEIAVNGGTDPYYQVGNRITSQYITDALASGRSQARENAEDAADEACTEELNDEPRPNYPRDGSYN